MTFSPVPASRTSFSLGALMTLAVIGALGIVDLGCTPQHIGRKCDLGADFDGGVTSLSSNTGALECPSRICIKPSQERTTDTGALCTAECTSDDDCADGEKRGSDPTDKRCKSGFVCRRLLPGLCGNELACKRLCACKDFLRTDDKGTGNTLNCNGDIPDRSMCQ